PPARGPRRASALSSPACLAGCGPRVGRSHSGIGAYPSGAALPSGGAPGFGAGGRATGVIVIVWALASAAAIVIKTALRNGFGFRIALVAREARDFAEFRIFGTGSERRKELLIDPLSHFQHLARGHLLRLRLAREVPASLVTVPAIDAEVRRHQLHFLLEFLHSESGEDLYVRRLDDVRHGRLLRGSGAGGRHRQARRE